MYKKMANFFNDNFTKQEENFIQKIIKSFEGFESSDYFHSQLQKSIESYEKGGVGKLIESIIKNEFFKQNTDYDKNLSSEPYLKFLLPKTDLKYHDNNLQIKTISFNKFYNNGDSSLIKTKFDTTLQTTGKIDLSTNELQEDYKFFVKKNTTLTLFIIYEFKNNFFNYQYFFLSKNKLINLLFQKNKQITFKKYNLPALYFSKLTKNELQTINPNKIKIDDTKIHTFQNNLRSNLKIKHLKTIQEILNNKDFNREFFDLIKNPTQNYRDGLNGTLIESLFAKYLNENKNFKKLLLDQSYIKQITNIPVDFIINNNFFQIKSFNSKIEQFQFKLFSNSNFPKNSTFDEKINFYNSKICNTLILTYCEKEEIIIPYFFTYNKLFINNKNQRKNKNSIFNFENSPGITCSHRQDKTMQHIDINITRNQKTRDKILKKYSLSSQIKQLEKTKLF